MNLLITRITTDIMEIDPDGKPTERVSHTDKVMTAMLPDYDPEKFTFADLKQLNRYRDGLVAAHKTNGQTVQITFNYTETE